MSTDRNSITGSRLPSSLSRHSTKESVFSAGMAKKLGIVDMTPNNEDYAERGREYSNKLSTKQLQAWHDGQWPIGGNDDYGSSEDHKKMRAATVREMGQTLRMTDPSFTAKTSGGDTTAQQTKGTMQRERG